MLELTKKEKTVLIKEQNKILENIMDKQEHFYKTLEWFENKHSYVPEKYKQDIRTMNGYEEYKRYKGWRNIPGIKQILKKAARKAVKNIIEKPTAVKMSLQERIKYLADKTKEMYKAIDVAKENLKKIRK